MINSSKEIGLSLGRLILGWSDKILMLALIGALAIGSTWLDATTTRPKGPVETDDCPGSGVIVDTEVVYLWLPNTVMELAASRQKPWSARTRQEWRLSLTGQERQSLWYATTVRCYQADGKSVDNTFIRRPYPTDAQNFAEFADVLAAAAGNPPARYAGAEVRVVSGDLSPQQARSVVALLVSGR